MKTFFQAFKLFCILTIVTGIFYPLTVTFIAQTCLPYQANGSLIYENGRLIGSTLLAQKFQNQKYFWSRPSAADFATVPSGASNQGATSAALKELVVKRAAEFRQANHLSQATPIPADVIFASGSGLDPHISLAAAYYQIPRVAQVRGISEIKVKNIIRKNTQGRFLGVIGEPVVNVLKVNLDLDYLSQK